MVQGLLVKDFKTQVDALIANIDAIVALYEALYLLFLFAAE